MAPGDALLLGRFDFVHSLRVLVNLLENAHKYSPPGAPVELTAAREDGRLVFRVADRGPGIAGEEAERVFEPFYRAPAAQPDAGERRAGAFHRPRPGGGAGRRRCDYEPRPGGGSVFVFSLPAADLGDADTSVPGDY